ncbi:MAG: McrBC 5-methylcytosine restriction system component [Candidatus Methanohalarchaeum thermophilum]|uniref:McrBC 5-methylcytosine restriction system component n=1 Tax=Methanohalarchaeum thermophilum TaxID=1903181 RepID=A0A1Q6DRU1_METT1|nr:MAG: McrBC 5-methylcytosine restriction system component [Candidatus Methanohalarchaeum thermophilum]
MSNKNIRLGEWEKTKPLELSDNDLDFLETRVNSDKEKIRLQFLRDGKVKLKSKQFIGIISLPEGPSIQIQPKAAGNILPLFRYAEGTDASIIKGEIALSKGEFFIDSIAQLFLDELKNLIQKGLKKSYNQVNMEKKYLRGNLDIQKQLQKKTDFSSKFFCNFEELNRDNLVNQSIIYSLQILLHLTNKKGLKSNLDYFKKLLNKKITLRKIKPFELQFIHLNRLSRHYQRIIEFCSLIIKNAYVQDIEEGKRASYSILVNMETIFEKVIEKAIKEGFKDTEINIISQKEIKNLLEGKPPVNLRPDILMKNEEETILVADSKWKTSRKNSDIYQIVAYQISEDVSGLLIYPQQEGEMETTYKLKNEKKLVLFEAPTYNTGNFQEWKNNLIKALVKKINELRLNDFKH